MFQRTVTERIVETNNTTLGCPTWIENLLTGLQALFIHPFFPLTDFGFKLKCLLSHDHSCATDSKQNQHQVEVTQVRSSLTDARQKYFMLFVDRLQTLFHSIVGDENLQIGARLRGLNLKVLDEINKLLSPNMNSGLILGQLVVCSLLLGYFVIEDTKDIMRQLRIL